MNQIPNIEETELIKFITDIVWEATDGGVKITPSQFSHFEEPIGALTDFQKYLHHQLQKARQDWLREEIVKLKRTDAEPLLRNRPNIYSNEHGEICKDGFNQALQTIIDRYQAELTQDPVHDFFTAPEEVQRPVYERALQKAQEEQEKMLDQDTPKE